MTASEKSQQLYGTLGKAAAFQTFMKNATKPGSAAVCNGMETIPPLQRLSEIKQILNH